MDPQNRNNINNLTTLIKRLEAATSRLEDIASSTIELPRDSLASPNSAASPPSAPTPTPPPRAPEPVPETVEEFDNFINTSVQKFVTLSNGLGDDLVKEQAKLVLKGFQEERRVLLVATKAKKPDLSGAGPDQPVFQELLQPINEALMAVQSVRDGNRGSKFIEHLNTVSDGIMVLAWVTVDHKPAKHIEDCLGSAQFFGNRVLKEYKGKDPQQVEWVQSFFKIFRDLMEYVKNYYPNGIQWNPKGTSLKEAMKSLEEAEKSAPPALSAPAAGGAPPPPPPPPPPPGPPPVLQIKEVAPEQPKATSGGGLGSVFAELNKGEAVTKGLRKVDKSEMTHKNPSLRAGSVVSDGSQSPRGKSPAPARKPKPESMRVKKPPKKELEGNKWIIENFEKEAQPIEIEASIAHSILISKCTNTTIIIRGKANAVTVENTNRLSLVVDSLVSTVDAVKSQNFALQVMGTIPTVMMDQIDGAQIYFSKESTSTRVFSSKSAGINLNVIAGEDGDYKEVPLPSQICSYYDEEKGDLVNEIVSHAG
ncbi:adenylyl cyclase-associated protein [Diplogelasinospora grovesii]|uniref:Adenylyl cyclase-associated protein n=1 Tax=Diplogelasinospora grovesii TaxID=303347 RepID=A0AAN6NFF9_9PEZI|nr:adenylyl cyclase-associated protein [Diplogelasinospora grovesii]